MLSALAQSPDKVSLSLPLSPSPSLSLSLSSLSLFLSRSLSFSLFFSLFLPLSLPLSLSFTLSLFLSLSLSFTLSNLMGVYVVQYIHPLSACACPVFIYTAPGSSPLRGYSAHQLKKKKWDAYPPAPPLSRHRPRMSHWTEDTEGG